MKLTAYLHQDRSQLGVLIVTSEPDLLIARMVCPCLGKSDNARAAEENNPTRNPLKPYGDLPTGTYSARLVGSSGPGRTYGPHKRLLLSGIAGDAKTALSEADKDGNGGRWNILVHGGALSAKGGLRPTLGCLRLSNDDMGALVKLLEGAGAVTLEVVELKITEAKPDVVS